MLGRYAYQAGLPKQPLLPKGGSLFVCGALFIPTVGSSPCERLPRRHSSPDSVSDEVLWTVEGFKENGEAGLWQMVTICELRNDASLSVHAGVCQRHPLCVCV